MKVKEHEKQKLRLNQFKYYVQYGFIIDFWQVGNGRWFVYEKSQPWIHW